MYLYRYIVRLYCICDVYTCIYLSQSSQSPKMDPLLETHLAESRQELATLREQNQLLQDQLSAREMDSIKVRRVTVGKRPEHFSRLLLINIIHTVHVLHASVKPLACV